MINTRKKWLLTASPWLGKTGRAMSAPIGGLILTAMLVFAGFVGFAQVHSDASVISATPHLGSGSLVSTSMPAISGANSVCGGSTITLSNATSGGVWTSGSTSVVTVNASSGVVYGVAPGVAPVTYTVGSSYTYTMITVVAPITGASTVCVNNVTTYTETTVAGNWSSSNTAIATITPTGVITGVSAGNVTINYTRPGCTVSQVLTVNPNTIAPLTGSSYVCVGAVTAWTDATTGGTWSSSNTSLATVDGSGNITGVAIGTPVITYAVGGCYKSSTISVNGTMPSAIYGSSTICTNNMDTLVDATTGGTWSSSNTAIASITNHGVMRGVSSGNTTISYTKAGCSATFPVTVNTNGVAPITGTLTTCAGGVVALADATAGGTWASGNTSIATVDGSGNVTGVVAGTPTIYYIQGGCWAMASVTVNSTAPASITGTGTVCVLGTTTLADATMGGTWTSSDTTLAKVSAWGVVSGIASGSPTITYTKAGCSTTTVVTVNANPAAIGGTLSLCAGATTSLTNTTTGGAWSSSATSVATVDPVAGVVTGIASGNATITYTVGGCFVTATVTVNSPAAITGGSQVCMGPFTYLYLYESTLGGAWTSSATTIATVGSTTGVVTGVAPGTATITFTKSGCYVTQVVTVNNTPGLITNAVAGAMNIACVGGSTIALTDTTVGGTWTSSNTAVATVNASTGVVTPVSAGSVQITYSNAAGCYRSTDVDVNTPPAAITGSLSVCNGLALTTLSDITTGGTWTTSNTNLHIQAYGVFQGASAGTTTVTYTVNNCYVTAVVTVNTNSVGSIGGVPNVCTGSTVTLTETTSGGTWSVRDTFATVSFSDATHGVITGLNPGVTVITYTKSGCFKTLVFAVQHGAGAIHGGYSVCNASSLTLTDDSTGGTWVSADPTIATINSGGVVTGITPGTVTITYSMFGGCQNYIPFTVFAMPTSILGSSAVGVAPCNIVGGAQVFDSTHGGVWSTSDATKLTVDGVGNLTGVAAGTANVSYTMTYGTLTCAVGKAITVANSNPAAIGGLASGNLCLDNSALLTDATASGTWATTNTYVVSVSGGTIVGVNPGTATISYTKNGCYVTKAVTVVANPVPGITGSASVCRGGSDQLANLVSGGTWSSSATTLATVNAATGLVQGIAYGYPIIKYTDPVSTCYQTYTLYVDTVLPSAISGAPGAALCQGNSTTTLTDATAGGAWTTSDPTIATITNTGIITAVGAGTAYLNYVVAGCGVAAPVTLNVTAAPNAITGTLTVCASGTTTLSSTTAGGTWSMSNATASVDAFGDITAGSTGNKMDTVSYTVSGCAATAVLTIGATPAAISGSGTVCQGGTLALTNTAAGGAWSTSNAAVGSLAMNYTLGYPTSGTVYANSAGVTTISYVTPGCTAVTKTITVNFTSAINGTSFAVCTNNAVVVSDTTSGGAWTISASSIATINAATTSCTVTGVTAGTATLTYTANGCTATQSIFVSNCGRDGGAYGSTINENVSNQSYTLYPNPSNGEITLTQGIAVDGNTTVKVTNYVGATVYSGSIQFAGGLGQLNISHINSGMYIIQLADNTGNVQSFKMVIEK